MANALNNLKKTYSSYLSSLYLTAYTYATLAYTYSYFGVNNYNYQTYEVGDLTADGFAFFKRINENSSLYSFNVYLAVETEHVENGYCLFDTYKTDHNIYVEYTGSGML